MKKLFTLLSCVLLSACGDYVEKKIKLDSAQETAISNFLTTECITKNTALFDALATNTADWQNTDIQKEFIYEYETTDKDPKPIIILKKTDSVMYIYVESTDAESKHRVYKYTTTDNANHLNALKLIACNAKNTFSGDGNNFSYTANEKNLNDNDTDENRIEYTSSYTVSGDRPVFFSLFSRQYQRKRYEDNKVKDTVDVTVNLKITATRADPLANYETEFNEAQHCVFDTTGATWLGANYPDTLNATMDDSPCATGVFSWAVDIIGP